MKVITYYVIFIANEDLHARMESLSKENDELKSRVCYKFLFVTSVTDTDDCDRESILNLILNTKSD